MKKQLLRERFFKKRLGLSLNEYNKASQKICDLFIREMPLDEVSWIHTFLPVTKNREVNTWLIVKKAAIQYPHIKFSIPRTDFKAKLMVHYQYHKEVILVENRIGIPEPDKGIPVAPDKFDIIIIPLLGYDKSGHRVGYGKGFYDIFLKECRPDARKVGLSFFPPVKEITDIKEHDIRLDCCVTPNEVINFN